MKIKLHLLFTLILIYTIHLSKLIDNWLYKTTREEMRQTKLLHAGVRILIQFRQYFSDIIDNCIF